MTEAHDRCSAELVEELKRARSELRSLQVRLEGILTAAVDGLVIIDETGTIEVFNPAAERIFGYSAVEAIGRNVNILMPSPYREEHDCYLHNYLGTGVPKIIGIGREVHGQRKDGSQFPMDIAVGELRTEGQKRFIGIVRDVTPRKNTEAALRAHEEELRLIVDNASVGIFMADRDGYFKAVNPAFCALCGRSREELLGTRFQELIFPDDRRTVAKAYQQLSDTCRTMTEELRLIRQDNRIAHCTLHCSFIAVPEREPRIIAQAVDRTEQMFAEAQAREQRERLAHVGRLSTMGEMASGIAHEINQPLAAIATYAQAARRMIERGMSGTPECSEALDQISHQAERAGEIIRRLRAFMRRHETKKELIDINEQLRAVIRLADVDLRDHFCKIETQFAEPLPRVMADAIQIQQVALNLIRNAVDAMDHLSPAQRFIRIRTLQAAVDVVEVQVEDQGPGVRPEDIEHLFAPFFTTKTQGMGLGLSISGTIIAAFGGRLWYRASPAGGAVFYFTLPLGVGQGT